MGSDAFREEWAGILSSTPSTPAMQSRVAKLFEEARDDVYRYLMTLGLHPPQAQEVTQEVFLRLYTTLRKGEEIRNDRAWIFRVAHNLGLRVRSRENARAVYDPDLGVNLVDTALNPERSVIEREQMSRVHEALKGLSEQQKRCLHLRMEGLRYPEIGAILGISPSTVSEFLRRAIARLKKVRHE
ncbi:RNA polymerase sigma factor [Paludibaculum fermentans]|uniref:RNA polymerase sigma factor n=1 Tax=Paludibaculum fermentans TaxID=1473598 RepID=UPI003EB90E13